MANVVILGAGLGGLPTAYELRHLLPAQHRVILVSEHAKFTFIPGLIRVALNLNPLEEVQLDVEQQVKPRGIEWVQGTVTDLDPYQKRLTVAGQTLEYDYLAIATGASLAFDEAPGLGPDNGYTQSVCTPNHALEAREAWLKYLEDPGPLVVGAMPGAGCFGPAYEFVLMADWELRKRGLRDKVTITYVTPEPYAGHLGVGGVKNAKELTVGLMEERGIQIIDNMSITGVDAQNITLSNGRQLPFSYSMILPAFRGAKFLQHQPFTNSRGFVPVTQTYHNPDFDSIYALGVAVALAQPDKTPIPIGLPKSGEMTEAMGIAVAHNIAVQMGAIQKPLQTPTLEALCFAEFGNTGIAYIAVPVIPHPITGKRKKAYAVKGAWVMWVKAAFEYYFMLKMQWGLAVPWFEKLGLRLLFQVNLAEELPITQLQDV